MSAARTQAGRITPSRTELPLRIAITGVGAVTALGRGVDALFDALCDGRSGLAQAPHWGGRGPTAMLPGAEDRLGSELAIDAVTQAISGFSSPDSLALVGATTSADMRQAEPAWQQLAQGQALDRPGDFVWPQLSHVPTQRVAQTIGARGPRASLSTACTSGAAAIGLAMDLLLAGRAPAAVAFGVDALCHTTVHGFGSLGLYDPNPSRPFSADRRGLNVGEGAGALLLEPLERAISRDADIIAILAGYGNTSDGYRLTAPDPSGDRAGAAIRQALGDLSADRIGYVCAHGTGTPLNDQTEAAVLARELPGAAVSGIKGAIGHTLGAAGAIEALVAAMAVHRGRIPPHISSGDDGFPELPLVHQARDVQLDAAVSVNFAFGGNNTALVVTRWR